MSYLDLPELFVQLRILMVAAAAALCAAPSCRVQDAGEVPAPLAGSGPVAPGWQSDLRDRLEADAALRDWAIACTGEVCAVRVRPRPLGWRDAAWSAVWMWSRRQEPSPYEGLMYVGDSADLTAGAWPDCTAWTLPGKDLDAAANAAPALCDQLRTP